MAAGAQAPVDRARTAPQNPFHFVGLSRRSLTALLLCASLALCAGTAAVPADGSLDDPLPTQVGAADSPFAAGGVVASAHPLATEVGMALLRAGGSAVDAAIGTALALGVVNPQSSGLGGGGFALYRLDDGATGALDFREQAPTFFNPDTYAPDGRDSSRGPWSTGIPGEPAGLAELHRIGGRLPWAEIVAPSEVLAREGFPVGPDLAKALARHPDAILGDAGLRADFSLGGRVLEAGETCTRPALARTLSYLSAHGGDALYSGPLAIALTGFLARQGLPWTVNDLASYEVKHREPLVGNYRNYQILSMPPPSSGGMVIQQSLGILERTDHYRLEFGSLAWTRVLLAALRHGFADRAAYGGDPDFVEIPMEELLAPSLLDRLSGRIPKRGPLPLRTAGLSGEKGELGDLLADDHGTSHLSVIDGLGSAVSLTTTINLALGSLQGDPQTGLILNDEMDDFAARPGKPNAFGLIQGENNRPEAGKRPLSSMSPTLVLDPEGRVRLALGGAGGPRIITATLQTLLAALDGGLTANQAVARARIHHQWLPEDVLAEDDFPSDVTARLEKEGFVFSRLGYAGIVQIASFEPDSGTWQGAADPRASGSARVWQP